MPKAVALFSGGLDSTLAIRILQQQGFEIEALNVRTTFDCCRAPAAQAAHELGVRLTVLAVAEDYVDVLRNPRHGYGKGMNPCVDCRTYMARMAGRLMADSGACVVITGEIVGQRPMSQKKRDLAIIEAESGLAGRLLRPLSAKLLAPTIPEQEGLIDRGKLYNFSGRNRSELIALAHRLGVTETAQPSTGCALTELTFAPRVRDLMDHDPDAASWDFRLLTLGRHIRFDRQTKMVVGRNASENASLELLSHRNTDGDSAYLHPVNFLGPDVLVAGRVTATAVRFAGALVLRFAKDFDPDNALVQITQGGATRVIRAEPCTDTDLRDPL